MLLSFPVVLALAGVALCHPDHNPVYLSGRGKWYQERNHSVHGLFKRAVSTDGTDYPEVGSASWSANYPTTTPDVTTMPQEWKDALNAAVAAGKIPDIAPSVMGPDGNAAYAPGLDPLGEEICSTNYRCKTGDHVIWDAPDNTLGLNFDDGPCPGTPKLLEFLGQNGETATHFLIGINILNNPDSFLAILDAGGDLAVHTYTHPVMTTLSNEEVVAQLGWTMQIIHDSSGGRVPKFWRPPTGDSDNRVNAIAHEVFGMTCMLWNQDTFDWQMSVGDTTHEIINSSMTTWLNGPKSPGLIILEHELTEDTVQAFMDAYPLMKSTGWDIDSAVLIFADSSYQNSDGTFEGSTVKAGGVTAFAASSEDDGDNDDSSSESSDDSSSTIQSATSPTTIPSQTPLTTSPDSASTSIPDNAASSPIMSTMAQLLVLLSLSMFLL